MSNFCLNCGRVLKDSTCDRCECMLDEWLPATDPAPPETPRTKANAATIAAELSAEEREALKAVDNSLFTRPDTNSQNSLLRKKLLGWDIKHERGNSIHKLVITDLGKQVLAAADAAAYAAARGGL